MVELGDVIDILDEIEIPGDDVIITPLDRPIPDDPEDILVELGNTPPIETQFQGPSDPTEAPDFTEPEIEDLLMTPIFEDVPFGPLNPLSPPGANGTGGSPSAPSGSSGATELDDVYGFIGL